MVQRAYWVERIESLWRQRSIIWLSGVRRVGKTSLCQELGGVEYFDCELPRTRREMEDPEAFLASLKGKRLVLDEIHRLPNPAELLKIAADHFPQTPVIATGSSTLGASAKFRDTLTGRKRDLWLTPVLAREAAGFTSAGPDRRMLHGGLPGFLLADAPAEADYQEWIDSFWAKDVQTLFRIERREAFARLIELILIESGGIWDASRFASACEISRPTASSYLGVLEQTYVAHVVRPYSKHRASEIIASPRVYGFDTGFVCHYRGWEALRNEDRGALLEHLTLNELQAAVARSSIHFWRTKRGLEVDFVVTQRGDRTIALECKWKADNFAPGALLAFRRLHPHGSNYVVAGDISRPYTRSFAGVEASFIALKDIAQAVASE